MTTKAILIFAVTFGVAAITSGQGTINFANVGAGISGVRVINGITGTPVAAGTSFLVQLYHANGIVSDERALMSVTDPPVGFSSPSVFTGGERFLAGISPSTHCR